MKIELDIFELFYFIEGCAHGSHLRQGIWRRCVNEFYGNLFRHERDQLFDWFTRLLWKDMCGDTYPNVNKEWKYTPCGSEDFQRAVACFDKNNRYIVTVKKGRQKETREAYLFQGKYWVDFSCFATEEYIINVTKKTI